MVGDLLVNRDVAKGVCNGEPMRDAEFQKKITVWHFDLVLRLNAERVRTNDDIFARTLLANTSVEVAENKLTAIGRRICHDPPKLVVKIPFLALWPEIVRSKNCDNSNGPTIAFDLQARDSFVYLAESSNMMPQARRDNETHPILLGVSLSAT